MPANNPNSPDAALIQGPGPTGNEGYPIATVPAPGAAATDVNIVGGGGGPVTIADGADVAEGATTDAMALGDVDATVEARLRGLSFILNSVFNQPAPSIDASLYLGIPNNPNFSFCGSGNTSLIALDGSQNAVIPEMKGVNLMFWPSMQIVWGFPAPGGGGAILRTPYVFKTVQANAAGNTALWTPSAGTKFRLMRYMVSVTGDASFAVAAVLTITLNDAGGAIGQGHDVYIPVAAGIVPGNDYVSPWIDLGNGILSAAGNNVLNVNLSAALATGSVRVICCGTEE